MILLLSFLSIFVKVILTFDESNTIKKRIIYENKKVIRF